MSKKAYFVEITYHAVVMAESSIDAEVEAESNISKITGDAADPDACNATEVTSLAQLARLDRGWTGDCLPYCGDGKSTLAELLPADDASERDTLTADLFAGQQGDAS